MYAALPPFDFRTKGEINIISSDQKTFRVPRRLLSSSKLLATIPADSPTLTLDQPFETSAVLELFIALANGKQLVAADQNGVLFPDMMALHVFLKRWEFVSLYRRLSWIVHVGHYH